ncbi:MAG: hypothetical protein AAF750_18290 [Planctomycetota bacterium]
MTETVAMMTQEREAKCWMLAAMVVVVWAVVLVGCGSVPAGVTAAAGGPDRAAWVWASDAGSSVTEGPALTLSADAAAPGEQAGSGEAAWSAWDTAWGLRESATRGPAVPRFGLGLRGLSIAQPLLSAKRVWYGAVAMLPPVGNPARFAAMSAVVHARGDDDPLASAAALSLAGADLPALHRGASVELGDAVRRAALPGPRGPEPGRPGLGLASLAEHAKLEDAGVLGGLVGVLLLIFGAESLVKRWRERRRGGAGSGGGAGASLGAAVEAAAVAQDEPSIFRFPEPVGDEAGDGVERRRAA